MAKRGEDRLSIYLKQAGLSPLLKRHEETALARSIEAGNEAKKTLLREIGNASLDAQEGAKLVEMVEAGQRDRQTLITSNLRLVISIAKRYVRWDTSLTLSDLIQEGNLGLMRAVEKFNWRKGNRLSTYATWWIRQFIQRSLDERAKTIRIPENVVRKIEKYRRTEEKLWTELGRKPTTEEITSRMGLTVEEVCDIKRAVVSIYSLEALITEDSEKSFYDFIGQKGEPPPSAASENASLRDTLAKALKKLPRQDQAVLSMRFGFPSGERLTLEQTAQKLGLTRERIRQIQERALERLRAGER